MSDCIDVEGNHVYKIGTSFDTEDGITVVLKESDEDWWVNGNQPPFDLHSLLRAWRRFQSFVSDLCVVYNLCLL